MGSMHCICSIEDTPFVVISKEHFSTTYHSIDDSECLSLTHTYPPSPIRKIFLLHWK